MIVFDDYLSICICSIGIWHGKHEAACVCSNKQAQRNELQHGCICIPLQLRHRPILRGPLCGELAYKYGLAEEKENVFFSA
jgi:hypothetical protein